MKGWGTLALDRCIRSIRAGVSVSGEPRIPSPGEPGILTLSAVFGGYFTPDACKAVPIQHVASLGSSVRAGTLLMSRSNTEELVGTTAIVEEDHPDRYLPDLLWEIELRDDSPLTARFLADYFGSDEGRRVLQSAAMGTSSSMKKLSMGRLRALEVPCTPLYVQRSWERLSRCHRAVVNKLDELVAAKHELKRALMYKYLPGIGSGSRATLDREWRDTALGELAIFTNGRAFRSDEWSREGVPIIRIQNLNGSRDFNYFRGSFDPSHAVQPGDVLFAWSGSRGTSFGATRWRGPAGVLNQHIFRVEPKEDIDPAFLHHLLEAVTVRVEATAHGGGGLVHVRKADLERFGVVVPGIQTQRKIARVFDALDAELSHLARLRDSHELQRSALLSRLLAGEWPVARDVAVGRDKCHE